MICGRESRTFLIKQSKHSAFAKLDLYGFADLMPFLSGSADTIELLHQIMAEYGEKTEQWYRPFCEAIRQRHLTRKQKQQELLNN